MPLGDLSVNEFKKLENGKGMTVFYPIRHQFSREPVALLLIDLPAATA